MKRKNIFILIFVSLGFLLFATASYSKPASTDDLWERATIIDQSGDFNAWPVENIFGPSATLFRDYQDAGFQHYVVWKKNIPISLDSINLIAWHDWGVDPHGDDRDRNYRGFSEFRLYYANTYENSMTDWKLIVTTATTNPYGGGPNYPGENWLELEKSFPVVKGQYFKAVFVQAGDGSDYYGDSQGPRVIELDGYGVSEIEYIIAPTNPNIKVGEKVDFLVYKVINDVITESVNQDRIIWGIVNLSGKSIDPYWDGFVKIGEINSNGEFTGINIGSCVVSAKIDNAEILKTDVTVKCPGDEIGDLWQIQRIYLDGDRIEPGPLDKDFWEGWYNSTLVSLFSKGTINNYLSYVPMLDEFDQFICGEYQTKVLKFLHKIQADPKECALLNGYEFGPIMGNFGGHHAVVIYPKGTDWKQTGTVLDPWLKQRPKVYSIEEWQELFSYFGYGVAGETNSQFRNKYPTTSDPHDFDIDFWGKLERGWDASYPYIIFVLKAGLFQIPATSSFQPGKAFATLSSQPPTVMIRDAIGGGCGVLSDGSLRCDVPDAFFIRIPVTEENYEGYEWFFIVNPDTCTDCKLEVTGTPGGELNLLTGNSSRQFHFYRKQSIVPGETAKLQLDISRPQAPLYLSDGSIVHPIPIHLPTRCLAPMLDLLLLE